MSNNNLNIRLKTLYGERWTNGTPQERKELASEYIDWLMSKAPMENHKEINQNEQD